MTDYISPEDEYTPSPWILWIRKNVWWIGAAMGLTFVTTMHFILQRRPAPPPVIVELPDFALVDQDGHPFGPEQMEGKVWVVGFVFTRCQSLCPPLSQAMVHFQKTYVAASRMEADVNLLTVSVDPEYDTPERLKAYAQALGADLDSWTFVTGTKAEIQHFVVDGFKFAVGEGKQDEAGVFDIAHSAKLAAVDRYGKVRHLSGTDPEALNELYHRLFTLMRAEADTP